MALEQGADTLQREALAAHEDGCGKGRGQTQRLEAGRAGENEEDTKIMK